MSMLTELITAGSSDDASMRIMLYGNGRGMPAAAVSTAIPSASIRSTIGCDCAGVSAPASAATPVFTPSIAAETFAAVSGGVCDRPITVLASADRYGMATAMVLAATAGVGMAAV